MNGSTTNPIYIHITNYKESDPQQEYYYNITRNNKLIFTQCIPDIPAGNNLTLYACESLVDCTSNPTAVITGINISAAPIVLSTSASIHGYMTMSIISSDHSSLLLSYSSETIFSSIAISSSTTIVDDNDALEICNKMSVTSGKRNMHMIIYIYFIIVILFGLSGVFLFLSITMIFVALLVCYFKRKRKHSQSNVTFQCV